MSPASVAPTYPCVTTTRSGRAAARGAAPQSDRTASIIGCADPLRPSVRITRRASTSSAGHAGRDEERGEDPVERRSPNAAIASMVSALSVRRSARPRRSVSISANAAPSARSSSPLASPRTSAAASARWWAASLLERLRAAASRSPRAADFAAREEVRRSSCPSRRGRRAAPSAAPPARAPRPAACTSALATDEPPNFITTRLMRGTSGRSCTRSVDAAASSSRRRGARRASARPRSSRDRRARRSVRDERAEARRVAPERDGRAVEASIGGKRSGGVSWTRLDLASLRLERATRRPGSRIRAASGRGGRLRRGRGRR